VFFWGLFLRSTARVISCTLISRKRAVPAAFPEQDFVTGSSFSRSRSLSFYW
jgi:hypothetical protein